MKNLFIEVVTLVGLKKRGAEKTGKRPYLGS
jgi:hypothetical protein